MRAALGQRTGAAVEITFHLDAPVDLVRTNLQGHASGAERRLARESEIPDFGQVNDVAALVAERLHHQCMAVQSKK